MDEIILVKGTIQLDELKKIASERGGDLVKAVVDVKHNLMALGGEMHADEEKFLLELGSLQDDLWGINIYPNFSVEKWIEFDSMINVRPRNNNRSRGVDDPKIQEKIIQIVNYLVKR